MREPGLCVHVITSWVIGGDIGGESAGLLVPNVQ